MKKKLKNSNGITLIALIITIIILLILAGISISALTQTGLFSRTKQAEQLSKEKQEEENATLGTYENEIGKYLGENSEETPSEPKKLKLVDKVNDGTIKIGDYVKYTPDVVTNTDKSYTDLISNLVTYSGSADNTTSTLTQEKNLNWRVLDVKDGQVRLISEEPTTSKITLSGAKGYNNAVYLLDKTCNTLYNNTKLSSKVQNLKIEDIQEYLTYDYKQYKNDYVDTGKYGGTKTYTDNRYYPNLLAKEKTGWVDGKQGTELDLNEQPTPINETGTQAKTSITVTQTYWYKSIVEGDFKEQKYYKLFVNNGTDYPIYWISSRCVYAHESHTTFRVRCIGSNSITAYNLYDSRNNQTPNNFAFRPVVTLNANVQIDTANSGNGSIAEQGYALK